MYSNQTIENSIQDDHFRGNQADHPRFSRTRGRTGVAVELLDGIRMGQAPEPSQAIPDLGGLREGQGRQGRNVHLPRDQGSRHDRVHSSLREIALRHRSSGILQAKLRRGMQLVDRFQAFRTVQEFEFVRGDPLLPHPHGAASLRVKRSLTTQ